MKNILGEYLSNSYKKKCVYHFTDAENIEGIQDHGLLSHNELIKNNIKFKSGGNQTSIRADRTFRNYVHLCFLKEHPMIYYIQKTREQNWRPVWFEVKLEVLNQEGVLYSTGVSNQRGIIDMSKRVLNKKQTQTIYEEIRKKKAHTYMLNVEQAKEILDFDHMYNWYDFTTKNLILYNLTHKYEILVPKQVAKEFIKKI